METWTRPTERATAWAALKHAGEDGLLPMQHYNL